MLQEISIKNFAIIEEITLNFDRGMTILTGETGAGKSIIIDAMSLLLGGRSSSDFVRHGADRAEIEGLFFLDQNHLDLVQLLIEAGIPLEDEIILRREILAEGRSTCRINGQLVNLGILRDIGERLIDIHGQHDNQELMDAKRHLTLLDEFGDASFLEIKLVYQNLFEDYKSLRTRLTLRQKNEEAFAQRIEVLQFQIEEIEAVGIDLQVDQGLMDRRNKLVHGKEIADLLNTAYLVLDNEEDSGLDRIRRTMSSLESVGSLDRDYEDLVEKTAEAYYLLEDVAANLSHRLDQLDFNPQELAQLEERIFSLAPIKKKYGPELVDVLDHLDKLKLELANLTGGEVDTEGLQVELKEKQERLIAAADDLTRRRQELARSLEADIKRELADLYMEKADFRVVFEAAKFSLEGNQRIEFYIKTNPGEGFKPLAKTASGGELSRLMLAIKSSFSRQENKTAIVFDEVDTGVSGRVAQAIAQKIYKIAQNGQVLAISHLPQVVAIADTQFFIEKASQEDVTTTTVRKLSRSERIKEIAKMLAGDDLTEEALAQAERLLAK